MQAHWFSDEAEALTQELIAALKKQSVRSEVLLSLYREMLQHRKDAIECCSKVAPYVHPKKEAISVEQKTEHRMVIFAPAPIDDVNVWLERCKADMSGRAVADDLRIDRAIENAKLKDSSQQHIKDDENPLDEIPD
jgi:hypothetical protein